MREVRVSGGYSDVLETTLAALSGDTTGATVRGVLASEGEPWPPLADSSWRTLTADDATPDMFGLEVPTSQNTGHYWWWLHVQAGATAYLVLVMDPDGTERPWHIWVH